MKQICPLLASIATAMMVSAGAASAVVVDYMGTNYDVTTKDGTFPQLNDPSIMDGTRLQDQVWWGDETAAEAFATSVGNALGYPNPSLSGSDRGPYFASANMADTVRVSAGQEFGATVSETEFTSNNLTYAVATEVAQVPLPAALPLLLAGLAGVAGIRIRSKTSAPA